MTSKQLKTKMTQELEQSFADFNYAADYISGCSKTSLSGSTSVAQREFSNCVVPLCNWLACVRKANSVYLFASGFRTNFGSCFHSTIDASLSEFKQELAVAGYVPNHRFSKHLELTHQQNATKTLKFHLNFPSLFAGAIPMPYHEVFWYLFRWLYEIDGWTYPV